MDFDYDVSADLSRRMARVLDAESIAEIGAVSGLPQEVFDRFLAHTGISDTTEVVKLRQYLYSNEQIGRINASFREYVETERRKLKSRVWGARAAALAADLGLAVPILIILSGAFHEVMLGVGSGVVLLAITLRRVLGLDVRQHELEISEESLRHLEAELEQGMTPLSVGTPDDVLFHARVEEEIATAIREEVLRRAGLDVHRESIS